MMPHPKYKFADFVIDIEQETLNRGEEIIKLNNRPFQILRLLVENAGKIVTKEEFAAQIWRGAFVEENNLTVAVAQIRKALAETKEAKFIETVPRKGYRFVAVVERAAETKLSDSVKAAATPIEDLPQSFAKAITAPDNSDEKPLAKIPPNVFAFDLRYKIGLLAMLILAAFLLGNWWQQASSAPAALQSIAVLPFEPSGDASEQIIFAENLTRDLTDNLGRIAPQKISTYDAAAVDDALNVDLAKVKAALSVDAAITGTIIKADGETLTIKIRLIDLNANQSIWEKEYSFKPEDLTQSQRRIARDLAKFLSGNEKSTTLLPPMTKRLKNTLLHFTSKRDLFLH